MRLPEPVGIRSFSTMLPITLKADRSGRLSWSGDMPVEYGANFRMMAFTNDTSWEINLTAPGSKTAVSVHELYSEFKQDEFHGYPGDFFVFDQMPVGNWKVEIEANDTVGHGNLDGYLVFADESPVRVYSKLTTQRLVLGEEIGLVAYAFDHVGSDPYKAPAVEAGMLDSAEMQVITPSGDRLSLTMYDDGLHQDGLKGDGIFGATFIAEEAGDYSATVLAGGANAEGRSFLRSAAHTFPVVVPALDFVGTQASANVVDDKRLSVSLQVSTFATQDEKYKTYAEVWGTAPSGEAVPVAWIGGIVYVENQSLDLGLDSRWIALSGARAPFELRNIRIQDVDTQVPLAQVDAIALDAPVLPDAARLSVVEIDEEMQMGPRPAAMASFGTGSRLLLVHGYCSGNMWNSVKSQFSNYSIFQDLNKNRSHDQFANLIANFGSTYNSFGVVAHSQGGAASLHLYANYWSGLDNATGNYLIQSVGTPYQGTNLAGNLAALAQIFGVQCGKNNDMTYNGASSWLSGIPNSARSKVRYFTTSFKERWWAYDYCHLATDLFLGDPDDGTTEKAYGQLPGANNGGHKKGWCHTDGMRDTAQYKDSSRNSSMNSNAAR